MRQIPPFNNSNILPFNIEFNVEWLLYGESFFDLGDELVCCCDFRETDALGFAVKHVVVVA